MFCPLVHSTSRENQKPFHLCAHSPPPLKIIYFPHSPHSCMCMRSESSGVWRCSGDDLYTLTFISFLLLTCLFIVASFQQSFRRQKNFPNSYLDLRKEKENYSSHVVLFHIDNKGDSSSSNSLVNQTALVTAQAGHKPHTSLNTGNVEELRVITKNGELGDWPVRRSQKKCTEDQSSRRKEQDPGGPSQGIFPSRRRRREQALAL